MYLEFFGIHEDEGGDRADTCFSYKINIPQRNYHGNLQKIQSLLRRATQYVGSALPIVLLKDKSITC